jgi:hypothetical protein
MLEMGAKMFIIRNRFFSVERCYKGVLNALFEEMMMVTPPID